MANTIDQFEAAGKFLDSIDISTSPLKESIEKVRASGGSVHVVVSVLSGNKQARSFYEKIFPSLLSKYELKEDFDCITHFTKSSTTVSDLATEVFQPEASQGKQLLVIVLSGDGGIVDLLNGLGPGADTEGYVPPIVATLPFGTANALAHSTRVASDETLGLRALCYGSPKPLPSFRVQFSPGSRLLVDEGRRKERLKQTSETSPQHPARGDLGDEHGALTGILNGAVVCSWGFHAAIVADSDTAEYRKHGIDRFKMAAEEALNPSDGGGPHQYSGDVYFCQNDSWRQIPREKHAYVLATSVSNLEKAFKISPATEPMDGSVKLIHFGPLSGEEVMRIMTRAYDNGRHIEESVVGYEDIEGLWIDFREPTGETNVGERWRRVCIDGTIVSVEENGWMCLTKDSRPILQLIVPTD